MDNYNYGRIKCEDHKGNVFPSKKARAEFYGKRMELVESRMSKLGWTLEEALTTPIITTGNTRQTHDLNTNVLDHKGNVFPSKKARAEFYGTTNERVEYHLSQGRTLEYALTNVKTKGKDIKFTDLKGRIFDTKKELYKANNIPYKAAINREYSGATLQQILIAYENGVDNNNYYDDIYNENISYQLLKKRYPECNKKNTTIRCAYRSYGYKLSQIVGVSLILKSNFMTFNKRKYNLTIERRTEKGRDVFECWIHNDDGSKIFRIMDYDEIDTYCIEQYKKLHNIS